MTKRTRTRLVASLAVALTGSAGCSSGDAPPANRIGPTAGAAHPGHVHTTPSRRASRRDCFVRADATPDAGPAPLEVYFVAQADCPQPLAFHWSFGDDTAGSDEPNPTHTYRQPDTYIAVVNVVAGDGSGGREEIDITVKRPPAD